MHPNIYIQHVNCCIYTHTILHIFIHMYMHAQMHIDIAPYGRCKALAIMIMMITLIASFSEKTSASLMVTMVIASRLNGNWWSIILFSLWLLLCLLSTRAITFSGACSSRSSSSSSSRNGLAANAVATLSALLWLLCREGDRQLMESLAYNAW